MSFTRISNLIVGALVLVLLFAVPANLALASTDTAPASPVHAVKEFVAGFIKSTDAIIASIESAIGDIATSITTFGSSASYTASAAAPEAAPQVTYPPASPAPQPTPAAVVVASPTPTTRTPGSSGNIFKLQSSVAELTEGVQGLVALYEAQTPSSKIEGQIASLQSALASQSRENTSVAVFPLGDGTGIAAASNIGNLSGVTITNANLTASEIPALDYLLLSGGTLGGNLQLNGNATTTGTSYFTSTVGIGTSTSDALAVNGSTYLADITPPTDTANRLYSNGGDLYWSGSVVASSLIGHWTSDGTNAWRVSGNVGIGTSSPFAALSVVGNGYFSGNLDLWSPLSISSGGTGTSSPTGAATNLEFLFFRSPSSVARTLASKLADTVSVKDFGATGNGSTDDTTAIQNALNAAAGGSLYVPAGTYIVHGLVLPSGSIKITCDGRDNTIFKLKNGANTYLLASHGYANDTTFGDLGADIEDCGFDGNDSNQTATSGLIFLRTYRSQISHDEIKNSSGNGLVITAISADGTPVTNGVSANRVEYSMFDNNTGAGVYGQDGGSNQLADNFINSEFNTNGGTSDYQVQVERSAGWEVDSNRFYGSSVGNLWLIGAGATEVNGNNLDNTDGSTTNVEIDAGGWGTVTISENVFHDHRASAASTVTHLVLKNLSASNPSVSITGNSFSFQYISGNAVAISGFPNSNSAVCGGGNSVDTNTTLSFISNCLSEGNYWTPSGNILYNNTGTYVGIGTSAPTSQFQLGGTIGSNSSGTLLTLGSTLDSTSTVDYLVNLAPTLASTSSATPFIVGLRNQPTIGSANVPSITNLYGLSSGFTMASTYTGTVSNGYDFVGGTPTPNGTNPFSNFTVYAVAGATNGDGITAGAIANRGFYEFGMTASSSAGGSVANYGASLGVPSGSPNGGTTNNYGLYITGNGGTSDGGTVSNYAIDDTSTANNYFAGYVGIGTTTPGSLLSLGGIANFTTATSTFYSTGGINLTGGCFSINGTCLTAFNGAAASSTLLTDNNTLSGSNIFTKAMSLTGTTGTTTISAGQGFMIGGSQFVVQQGSGNVGIGTISPGSELHIFNSSDAEIRVASGANFGLLFDNFSGGGSTIDEKDNSYLQLETNNTGRLWIVNNGNVGIGTSSPATTLSISGNDYITGGEGVGVENTTAGTFQTSGNAIIGGNLGVGTTTPYSRLEVFGPDTASTSVFAVVNSASTTEFTVYDTGNATLAGNLVQNSDIRLKTHISDLDGSSSLADIDALNPVTFNWIDPNKSSVPQFGFIAQQVQQVFPNLVSTTSPTALTPDGTLSLNYVDLLSPIVAAIQELDSELTSLASTVAGFAENFATQHFSAHDVTTQELCVGATCVTPAQFQAMVVAANQSGSAPASPPPSSTPEATDTPPVIQINGANPAIIQGSASYADLGATITGPQADLNLGIQTYLNGTLESPIELDTSAAATDTIAYVVTDGQGLTSTSTRTVIVEPAVAPPAPLSAATSSLATTTTQ